jgi:hypothetical protein
MIYFAKKVNRIKLRMDLKYGEQEHMGINIKELRIEDLEEGSFWIVENACRLWRQICIISWNNK